MVRLSGYGQSGPDRDKPGFGVIASFAQLPQAMLGTLYSLLMLDVQLTVAVLAVLYEKISFAGVGVILLFISFVLVTSSVLFHQDFLFGGLPLIQWVVNGLTAVRTGEESRAMFYIDAMAGIMVLLFLSVIRLIKE